jgi:hypothetical protein
MASTKNINRIGSDFLKNSNKDNSSYFFKTKIEKKKDINITITSAMTKMYLYLAVLLLFTIFIKVWYS